MATNSPPSLRDTAAGVHGRAAEADRCTSVAGCGSSVGHHHALAILSPLTMRRPRQPTVTGTRVSEPAFVDDPDAELVGAEATRDRAWRGRRYVTRRSRETRCSLQASRADDHQDRD